jgi:uncharacterized protein YecE (DUF72 family)
MLQMVQLYFGTSSWSEPSWHGVFYPPGTKPAGMLAHYATQFSVVEADNTYYRIPSKSMVRGWRERTPEGFKIAAKFPRTIVHGGDSDKPDASKVLLPGAELDTYLDAMRELGPRAGPLVIQLPYFNRSAFATVGPFLERLAMFLDALPDDFRYAVEVRNKAWIDAPLLELLRSKRMALVLVDIAYMPHPADFVHDLVTTDFVYARLIGDRKGIEALTTTFDRTVLDQSERIARWAELLHGMQMRVKEIWALANNHYSGYGPDTVRHLIAKMSEKLVT